MMGGGRRLRDHLGLASLRRAVAPRFDDPEQEAAFCRDRARETTPMIRSGFIVGVVMWIAIGVILPLATAVDQAVLYAAIVAMVAIDVGSFFLVRGEPSLARIDAVGIVGSVANSVAILALAITARDGLQYTLPGLMLTTLYAVAVFRIRIPGALLPAVVIIAVFLLAVATRVRPAEVAFEVFLLAFMMVIGMIGVIALDRASRERFLQRRVIEAQREEVVRERAKSDALLRSILPISIVARLRERPEAVAERLDETTLLFADLVGFTSLSERLGAQRTVTLLNALVSRWDVLAAEAGVEKIKTIGDAYFAAAGVPERQDDHARRIVDLGLAMIRATADIGRSAGEPLAIRVGVHSGPVVAGVIGKMKFSYDLWGDTVNVASRLESSGVPGEIQVGAATVALLGDEFDVVPRGTVALKGKGPMATFLVRPRSATGANGSASGSNGGAPASKDSLPVAGPAVSAAREGAPSAKVSGASVQSGHD